jgi:hypothetical protein
MREAQNTPKMRVNCRSCIPPQKVIKLINYLLTFFCVRFLYLQPLGHFCKRTLFLKRILKKLLRQRCPKLRPLGEFI